MNPQNYADVNKAKVGSLVHAAGARVTFVWWRHAHRVRSELAAQHQYLTRTIRVWYCWFYLSSLNNTKPIGTLSVRPTEWRHVHSVTSHAQTDVTCTDWRHVVQLKAVVCWCRNDADDYISDDNISDDNISDDNIADNHSSKQNKIKYTFCNFSTCTRA